MATRMITVPESVADLVLKLIASFEKPAAPPAPSLAEVWARKVPFPEPAGFEEETVIGHVAGEPVYGLAYWNEEEGCVNRYDVRCTIGGLQLTTDGESIHTGTELYGEGHRWPVATIGRLLELGQGGELAAIIRLGRQWCAAPAVEVERKAA